MCLLAFSYQQHPQYPFILIGNRDEFYQRATKSLDHWPESSALIGGRDLVAGGSWLAANSNGRFASVTNYRDGRKPAASDLRSRGELIREFLTSTLSAEAFSKQLLGEVDHYGGFNLILFDNDQLVYISSHERRYQKLKPGCYGLSNASLDTPWPKTVALTKRLKQAIDQPQLDPDKLLPLLTNCEQAEDQQLPDTGISYEWEKMLSSCFIHSDSYGTRASTIVLLNNQQQMLITEQNYGQQGPTEQKTCKFSFGL